MTSHCKSWEGLFRCACGFKMWPEQQDCRFADADANRLKCRHADEVGQCKCLEAHAAEREKSC